MVNLQVSSWLIANVNVGSDKSFADDLTASGYCKWWEWALSYDPLRFFPCCRDLCLFAYIVYCGFCSWKKKILRKSYVLWSSCSVLVGLQFFFCDNTYWIPLWVQFRYGECEVKGVSGTYSMGIPSATFRKLSIFYWKKQAMTDEIRMIRDCLWYVTRERCK